MLADGGLGKIRKANVNRLKVVPGKPRLGPCVGNVRNFIAIGLNYADHAAEAGAPIPKEPIIFSKAPTWKEFYRRTSSASARPRSPARWRSWNSSNSSAPIPANSGSSCSIRVRMPSVTTSIRLRTEIFASPRIR